MGRTKEISAYLDSNAIDLIWAHSSFAGVYARIVKRHIPVIYQPHCFAFDDRSRPFLIRLAYRVAEEILARRTTILIALTKHEVSLGRSLSQKLAIEQMPNVPTVPVRDSDVLPNIAGAVVMIGRITDQKGPGYFSAIYQGMSKDHVEKEIEFVWIGDGDPHERKLLEDAGVRVTGWLTAGELVSELDRAGIYVHTATYEGFPLSVLDAAARRVPILVREHACFVETNILTTTSHHEAGAIIANIICDKSALESLRERGDDLLQQMNDNKQGARILQIVNKTYT